MNSGTPVDKSNSLQNKKSLITNCFFRFTKLQNHFNGYPTQVISNKLVIISNKLLIMYLVQQKTYQFIVL